MRRPEVRLTMVLLFSTTAILTTTTSLEALTTATPEKILFSLCFESRHGRCLEGGTRGLEKKQNFVRQTAKIFSSEAAVDQKQMNDLVAEIKKLGLKPKATASCSLKLSIRADRKNDYEFATNTQICADDLNSETKSLIDKLSTLSKAATKSN